MQLPVWQQFVREHRDVNFAAIAIGVQGAEAARPYAAGTLDTFPTLLDERSALPEALGLRGIPDGVLVDVDGRIEAIVAGGFDIRRAETRELLERWLASEDVDVAAVDEPASAEARRLFHEGVRAFQAGDRSRAITLLTQAYPLEPDNLLIRRQLWSIEHPERFYDGDVDVDWQDEQLRADT
jgi:hypothetical protein